MATLGTGYDTRRLYNAYRQGYAEKHAGAATPADRFAYLGLVAVGHTEDEARRRGELIASYPRTSSIVFAPFRNPPGYLSIEDNVRILKGEGKPRSFTKDGRVVEMAIGSVQDLIDAGVMFCGTPDQVYNQIADFVEHCGGMGNLLMMGHAGPMSHDDTVENLTIFAKEVYPRLKDMRQPEAGAVAAQ
jgi:alkanesulfonate monooxygenase SsuD/methylene tetrahydromethanopterin reductase-like flavin-dependent oxidoreductase (luciferase family)